MRTLSGEKLGKGLHELQKAIYETDDLIISGGRLYLVLDEFEYTTLTAFKTLLNEGTKVVDYVAYYLNRLKNENTIPLLAGFNPARTSVWSTNDETGICIVKNDSVTAFKFTPYGIYSYADGDWSLLAAADTSGITKLIGETVTSYINDPVLKTYRFRRITRDSSGNLVVNTNAPKIPGATKSGATSMLIEEIRFIGEELIILPIGMTYGDVKGKTFTITDKSGNTHTVSINSTNGTITTDLNYYSLQLLYL